MMLMLDLDGTPYTIDGRQYPSGVGMPREGDEVIVGAGRYRVTRVVWRLAPLDTPALTRVDIRVTRIGAAS